MLRLSLSLGCVSPKTTLGVLAVCVGSVDVGVSATGTLRASLSGTFFLGGRIS